MADRVAGNGSKISKVVGAALVASAFLLPGVGVTESSASAQSNNSGSAPQSFEVTRKYIQDKCIGAVGLRRWHNKYHGPQSANFRTSRLSVYSNGDVRFTEGGRYPTRYAFNIKQVRISYHSEGNYILVSSSNRRIVVGGDQTTSKAYLACNKSQNVAKAFRRLKSIALSNQEADPFD